MTNTVRQVGSKIMTRDRLWVYGLTVGLLAVYSAVLYGEWWGVNGIVVTNLVAVAVLGLAYKENKLTWRVGLLTALVVGFGVARGGRMSEFLVGWNWAGYVLAWGLLASQVIRPRERVRVGSLGWRTLGGVARGELTKGWGQVRELQNLRERGRESGVPWAAIGRGVPVSVPVLPVFLGLFVAADVVYARGIGELLTLPNIDLWWVLRQGWWGLSMLGWGVLIGVLLPAVYVLGELRKKAVRKIKKNFAHVELGVLLGSMNVLFASFLVG